MKYILRKVIFLVCLVLASSSIAQVRPISSDQLKKMSPPAKSNNSNDKFIKADVSEFGPSKCIVAGAENMGKYLLPAKQNGTAIVANQASMVGDKHLVDTLLSLGADIRYILCPEHGFRGDAEAGKKVKNSTDEKTGLPIISLYGNNKKPKADQLKGVSLIIFDLQDVGCRFYTYISTLHYVMEYCAENNVRLIVLDRPNPNTGYVDGPVLEEKYKSFVGMHPGVPVVYGMTIGEYARMIKGEKWISDADKLSMEVVKLANFTHDSIYHLPVAPSPNLRTHQAMLLYPSLCLFEGTNISVGRGTDMPFEVLGAPSYSGRTFSFVPESIKGVSENPPHKGETCYGLDLRKVKPKRCFDLSYIMTMYSYSNKKSFFLKGGFFENLAGTATLREQLQDGAKEEDIRASWKADLEAFKLIRKKYLLYD